MRCTVAATSVERRCIGPGEVLARLNREGGIPFRSCDEHGNVTPGSNPGILSGAQKCARDDAAPRVKIFNSMIANIEEYRRQRVVQ
ncbi:hypothetical protein [Methanoculleus sp. MH98A]|uniref:hypothetical protein n=1 Tax=Methanoculleus sp. MH98A TaxID=1495314 RepID=UPI00049F40F5|nr:hypothetical protein [Methanoculleus sp. MH98A]KDE55754.1 hypothetical protein EI28_05005 [Methanoculleus sp. MH98A]